MANSLEVTNGMKTLVIAQIRDLYPDETIRIYDQPVMQGLKVPAFLVRIYKVYQERSIRHQAFRTFYFSVVYFPSTSDYEEECLEVLEVLQNNFKYIQNRYHVHEIEGEIVDKTLVITFNTKARMEDVLEFVKMKTLEVVDFVTRTDNEAEN